jgi:hypothetical protein
VSVPHATLRGGEAIKSGVLTPYRLRSRCVAIHPDVYVATGTDLTAAIEAGYPPPQTRIPIYGEYGELVAVLDMGWE